MFNNPAKYGYYEQKTGNFAMRFINKNTMKTFAYEPMYSRDQPMFGVAVVVCFI